MKEAIKMWNHNTTTTIILCFQLWMVGNGGNNLNFWWPWTSIINVSYNLKVRPCSNTPDTRLPSYCLSEFVFVQHGSYFCLSKHAGACAAAVNNLPMYTLPGSLQGAGAGPKPPLLWSEGNLLDLFKTTTHSRQRENPKPGLSHALRLCGPACMLQTVTCVTGGWTQAAHVNHTLMRQTLKHVDHNNSWPSSNAWTQHSLFN